MITGGFAQEYKNGVGAYDSGDFHSAKIHFQAASDLAGRYSENTWSRVFSMNASKAGPLDSPAGEATEEFRDVPERAEEIQTYAAKQIQSGRHRPSYPQQCRRAVCRGQGAALPACNSAKATSSSRFSTTCRRRLSPFMYSRTKIGPSSITRCRCSTTFVAADY